MTTNPSTNPMFAILEPMTLPITISESPDKTAAIEVANSGNEVPKATIVIPITNGDIPKESPIFSAESMNQSDPLSKTKRAITKMNRFKAYGPSIFPFHF